MVQILYKQMKDVADAVQACIDHGGMSLWSALVDVMNEVDGISVEPDCRYAQCDHGTGLAEKGNCPAGNPADRECAEFTTEYSEKPEDDVAKEWWRWNIDCDGGNQIWDDNSLPLFFRADRTTDAQMRVAVTAPELLDVLELVYGIPLSGEGCALLTHEVAQKMYAVIKKARGG